MTQSSTFWRLRARLSRTNIEHVLDINETCHVSFATCYVSCSLLIYRGAEGEDYSHFVPELEDCVSFGSSATFREFLHQFASWSSGFQQTFLYFLLPISFQLKLQPSMQFDTWLMMVQLLWTRLDLLSIFIFKEVKLVVGEFARGWFNNIQSCPNISLRIIFKSFSEFSVFYLQTQRWFASNIKLFVRRFSHSVSDKRMMMVQDLSRAGKPIFD